MPPTYRSRKLIVGIDPMSASEDIYAVNEDGSLEALPD